MQVLDIGCGEGQLLSVLSVPSPWLPAPPQFMLYPNSQPKEPIASPLNLYNTSSDPIPNLHITRLVGLDISSRDLEFAAQAIAPPANAENTEDSSIDPWRYRGSKDTVRWEEMTAKLWEGGLETINEEFVGTECIVSSEVIEHLSPTILPFFAPILLGVYKPKFLLITTPSYTFNALFTSPNSHPSVRLRTGYSDPTCRTDRIFRHDDHKFEWTPEEFHEYCKKEAVEWGYTVDVSDIGRAQDADEWGRDTEVGGASLVAIFTRNDVVDRDAIEEKARAVVQGMLPQLQQSSPSPLTTPPQSPKLFSPIAHRLLTTFIHPAHASAYQPLPLHSIGDIVKSRMEDLRESFLRVEELWYEPEVAQACGGWIELLIAAVEQYDGSVIKLVKDADSPEERRSAQGFLLHSPIDPPVSSPEPHLSSSSSTSTSSSSLSSSPPTPNSLDPPKINRTIQRERDLWKICLVNAQNHPRPLWPTTEILINEEGVGDKSVEYMSSDWNPEEEYAFEYGNVSGYSKDVEKEEEEDDQDEEEHSIDSSAITEDDENFDFSRIDFARTVSGEGTSAEWSLDEEEKEDVNPVNYSTNTEDDSVTWGESDITTTSATWGHTIGDWGEAMDSSTDWGEGTKSDWGGGSVEDGEKVAASMTTVEPVDSDWEVRGQDFETPMVDMNPEKLNVQRNILKRGRSSSMPLTPSSHNSLTGWEVDGDVDDTDGAS
ncbi:hypothetical protein HHX47_DHR10000154 [Lentinula edodes]|nr:hypothetical protein HHX47_DHR10000154 [Lentinula edodes]